MNINSTSVVVPSVRLAGENGRMTSAYSPVPDFLLADAVTVEATHAELEKTFIFIYCGCKNDSQPTR